MSRMSELLPSYPHGAGYKEPTTSKDAAKAMASRVGPLQRRVLDALAIAPDVPDTLALRIGIDRLSIRPRFTELAALGLIEKTGERRANGASGLKAAVWRVKP